MDDRTITRWICATGLLSCAIACDSGSHSPNPEFEKGNYLPRAIADLRALSSGDITLNVSINGNLISDNRLVNGNSTDLILDPSQLNLGENSVSITFYFESQLVDRRAFVTGDQTLSYDGSASLLQLSGLHYRYFDTDSDGIFDVHELAVEPVDIDSDGRLNPDDEDSDNDNLIDGEDPAPWGMGSTPDMGALLAEIDVRRSNGALDTLLIDQIVGGSGETARLANLVQPLPLVYPPTWPSASQLGNMQSHRWTAFELQIDGQGLCSQFRIPLDISSLKLYSSSGAILYFERYTGPPQMTTLDGAELSNLDFYNHLPPLDGDGPLNDALRIILVPDYHAGWIDAWTGSEFSGDNCSINLTTPSN